MQCTYTYDALDYVRLFYLLSLFAKVWWYKIQTKRQTDNSRIYCLNIVAKLNAFCLRIFHYYYWDGCFLGSISFCMCHFHVVHQYAIQKRPSSKLYEAIHWTIMRIIYRKKWFNIALCSYLGFEMWGVCCEWHFTNACMGYKHIMWVSQQPAIEHCSCIALHTRPHCVCVWINKNILHLIHFPSIVVCFSCVLCIHTHTHTLMHKSNLMKFIIDWPHTRQRRRCSPCDALRIYLMYCMHSINVFVCCGSGNTTVCIYRWNHMNQHNCSVMVIFFRLTFPDCSLRYTEYSRYAKTTCFKCVCVCVAGICG